MWDLMLSDDQTMIGEAVDQFLAGELPLERLRPRARATDEDAVWRGMAELGWFGIGVAEAAGGAGLGLIGEMLIQRACGRHLATPSVLATMIAVHVALAAADNSLAQALIAGERRAALSIAVNGGGHGERLLLVDWRAGDLVLCWNDSGAGLVAPDQLADIAPDTCLDDSLTLHSCRAVSGYAAWVNATEAPLALRIDALIAARLTGLAEVAAALAADYAKLREQFGKPIGTFQAVKHRCADMLMRAEMSAQSTALACLKLQVGACDAAQAVAAARLKAAHAAHENGRAAIQIHGGIGFHAECDAHWTMKRAHVYDLAGGSMQVQADRLFLARAR